MVNNFRVILCPNAGEELSLGFRNAKPIKSILDVIRHVIPTPLSPIRGFDIVIDIIKVELGQIATPIRHWLLPKNFVSLHTIFTHPIGLVLDVAHLIDDFGVQALP